MSNLTPVIYAFFMIGIILLVFGCTKKEKLSNLNMPDAQYKALTKRIDKSVDIKQSLRNADYTILKQTSEITRLTSEMVNIDSLSFEMPPEIKVPKLVETDNYWIIYNVILSPPDSNIVKYNKQGNFLSTFARKGRGPNEVTKIDAIAEKNHKIYISDNGSLKEFNRQNELIDQKLLKIWAHDIRLNKNDYDLRSSANKVFSFPIYTLDNVTDNIKHAINDNRKDVFNYKSSNNTTFYSNDTLIIYAKTPTNKFHVFSKLKNRFTNHYQVEAYFIRENEEVLPERPSKSEFMQFYNSLFLIDKIHLFQDELFITFSDRKNGATTYYLAKTSLNKKSDQDFIPLKVYQTNNIFKTTYFFEDHLYYYSPSKNERNLTVHTIQLDEL